MERETRMLLWTLFAVGVLTVGLMPAAFGSFNHAVAIGVKSNNDMAQALWGQSPPLSPTENTWLTNTNVPILPGADTTHVDSVSWNTSTWGPKIVISGYGFGNPPTASQTVLLIQDTRRGWTAADGSSFLVQPTITSWKNDRIVVDGFDRYGVTGVSNGSAGQGSEVFAPGDPITVSVTNPQTGSSGSFQTQYPMSAPMPMVTLNPLQSLMVGQSELLSGRVSLKGTGLADQAVTLSAAGGQIRPHVVVTDRQGIFTATFTAPGTGGTESVMASCDGGMGTAFVTVRAFTVTLSAVGDPTDNQVTLTATVNQPLRGATLRIHNRTTGQIVAQTDQGTTLSTRITMQPDISQTFVAQID
ncbi:hypothetical protein AYW79_09565 [Ferroacidibacillus organovorans]|uniref:Uncharacterized protein n=1 Tax=Ferroacidibacillus organovorans TaxID=1765683 RepID=A0A853KBT9_9BACL|nr:hypothetical protein [Ferroacidibacillus organovorans]OAG93599.1 hypothetical protein AYW79_09565 [Ferroacidibacillus organovorans]